MKSRMLVACVSMIAAMLAACSKSGNEDVAGPDRLIDEAVTLTVDLNTGSVTQAGYEWVDNSGVIHLQGRVIEGATVSGDLVGKFKTTITNSERNPQTGAGRETLIVECAMNWPSENRQGLFTGGMTQEFKTGARAPASLNAQGKEGFASLNLEVTFEEEAGNVKILVGKGRIVER